MDPPMGENRRKMEEVLQEEKRRGIPSSMDGKCE